MNTKGSKHPRLIFFSHPRATAMLPGVKLKGTTKGTAALSLCVLLVFIAAALLSPWAYRLLHPHLAYPFHSYVDRSLMLAALAAIPLFWRRFDIASWQEIGVKPEAKIGLAIGLAIALLSTFVTLAIAIAAGGRILEGSAGWGSLGTLLLAAALVAPLEELLFRGIIQTVLIRGTGPLVGIVLTSLFFALVHFIKVPSDFTPDPVTAGSGFTALGLAFAPFADFHAIATRFLLLASVGGVLGLAAWRTGRLWLPIGLHAGWIIGAKLGGCLTAGIPNHWASGDFTADPLSFAALALVALLLWKCPRFSIN